MVRLVIKCRKIFVIMLVVLAFVPAVSIASGAFTLRDYDHAIRANNHERIMFFRSYILGAVETHLVYSRMLSDWTRFNALCTGDDALTINELGSLFELKVMALRKRYGKDIMGMPIVEVVPMIVEEHYKCF